MASPDRRRAAVLVIPLVLAFFAIRRVAENVRTVDFLQILAAGMIIGISLSGIIHMMKAKGTSKP